MIIWKYWHHLSKKQKNKGVNLVKTQKLRRVTIINPPISPNSQRSKKSWILFFASYRKELRREERAFSLVESEDFQVTGSQSVTGTLRSSLLLNFYFCSKTKLCSYHFLSISVTDSLLLFVYTRFWFEPRRSFSWINRYESISFPFDHIHVIV